MKYCEQCKTERFENALFCNVCGSRLTEKAEQTAEEEVIEETVEEIAEAAAEEPVEAETYGSRPEDSEVTLPTAEAEPAEEDILTESDAKQFREKRVVIVMSCVFLLLIGIIVVCMLVGNSAGSKEKSAENMLIEGDYQNVRELLEDIYDPRAVALKRFALLEQEKDDLIGTLKNGGPDDASAGALSFFDTLVDYKNENYSDYLPAALQNRFRYYMAASRYYYDHFITEDAPTLESALSDSQGIMMNELIRWRSNKNGNTFRLCDLEDRMDTAKEALDSLGSLSFTNVFVGNLGFSELMLNDEELLRCQHDYFGGGSPLNEGIVFSAELKNMVSALYKNCSDKTDWYESFLEEQLKEWDYDDELYMVNPRPDDVAYIAAHLEYISSWEEIYANTGTIMRLFQRDILYYLFCGSAKQ